MSSSVTRLIQHYPRRSATSRGPTCIDLFSGAGGLAEGFLQAGFSVLAGSDIARAPGATFRRNFRTASFFECHISDLSGTELLADAGLHRGELDCLLGGVPCQSFSYNNHERSRRGARAQLFRHYLRIVEALEPRTLVMENVPGILTVGGGRVMDEIYGALGELGYECEARILYAEDYGVPQERRRVFFVATRLGWEDALFPKGSCGPVWKPSPSANPYVHRWERDAEESRRRAPGIWAAIGDLPRLDNGEG
ncbi:MAG TPA: DNA (cytosine-5-)-methyltransferase, partial [Gemmatimonadaceae bacterium]